MSERVRRSGARAAPPAVDRVLREMLQDRWLTFARRLARVRRKGSAAAIHDLRVATRRLLATLTLAEAVPAVRSGRKVRRPARALLKTLNALRDTQVQHARVIRLARSYPVLRSYVAYLRRQEGLLLKSASVTFREFPVVRIEESVGLVLHEVDRACAAPAARRALLLVLKGGAAAAYARAAKCRQTVRDERPETLHRFRIAFKKFRYSIELLGPVFPWVTRELRSEMDVYQTVLGEIQDLEVLSADLRTFARRRRPRRTTPAPSFLSVHRALERRRELLLRRFGDSAGRFDDFWDPPRAAVR